MENEKVFKENENNISEDIKSEQDDTSNTINNSCKVVNSDKKFFLKELYEWTQAIAIAVVLALVINHFIFSIVQVQGESMLPTLENNERLFVRKFLYEPKNKDIVIVKSEVMNKYIVKRVIATEGQTIDIKEDTCEVYVDGKLQNEPYINENIIYYIGNSDIYPLTIPEDCVFVMGDNRAHSYDSRGIGVVKNSEVMGKAIFRIWPFDSLGGLYDNLE